MNSLNPVSQSSIIYDTDFQRNTITIAQPIVPITKTTAFDQLHITTTTQSLQQTVRAGIECISYEFLDQYRLANQTISRALALTYKLPVMETNIRSAFRLPLSHKHTIKAKILYKQTEYYTAKDFGIRDISFTGMGLVIPKNKAGVPNPLTAIRKSDIFAMGVILVDRGEEKPVGSFPVKAIAIRVNKNYSDTHILVGLKITQMGQKNEILLNRFIHNAQIDELKRLRAKNN
ncbi:MAG: hypothetical protein KKC20_00085 [Proteobacteria bacterium]|nr:hypothetical protein [Pseudomonadota bacterium]